MFIQRQIHRTGLSDRVDGNSSYWDFPWDSAIKLQHPFSLVIDTPREIAPSARLS